MYIYILIISINIHKPQLVIFELSVNLAIVWGPTSCLPLGNPACEPGTKEVHGHDDHLNRDIMAGVGLSSLAWTRYDFNKQTPS